MIALDILRKANERGEVGYAWPNKDTPSKHDDWPLVQECLDRGWLVYVRDASIGPPNWTRSQTRDIYAVTQAGLDVLTTVDEIKELPRGVGVETEKLYLWAREQLLREIYRVYECTERDGQCK